MNHAEGSLEEHLENLIKSWHMEVKPILDFTDISNPIGIFWSLGKLKSWAKQTFVQETKWNIKLNHVKAKFSSLENCFCLCARKWSKKFIFEYFVVNHSDILNVHHDIFLLNKSCRNKEDGTFHCLNNSFRVGVFSYCCQFFTLY